MKFTENFEKIMSQFWKLLENFFFLSFEQNFEKTQFKRWRSLRITLKKVQKHFE